jgi:hypothetical protein
LNGRIWGEGKGLEKVRRCWSVTILWVALPYDSLNRKQARESLYLSISATKGRTITIISTIAKLIEGVWPISILVCHRQKGGLMGLPVLQGSGMGESISRTASIRFSNSYPLLVTL